MPVLMQPRLFVEVLAGESVVDRHHAEIARVLIRVGLAERQTIPLPDTHMLD